MIINKLPLNNQNIKIEGEILNDKSDNENESEQYGELIPKSDSTLKSNEYKIHFNTEDSNSKDNSAYSIGDEDKLYLKLEKFIKILIQN